MAIYTTYEGSIFLGIIALFILIISAEIAVKKILSLAAHYKISPTFAGLSIFPLSTSFPKNLAHISASIGIVTGTLDFRIASTTLLEPNIGSDVVQQTLILGAVVLLLG